MLMLAILLSWWNVVLFDAQPDPVLRFIIVWPQMQFRSKFEQCCPLDFPFSSSGGSIDRRLTLESCMMSSDDDGGV